MYCQWASEEPCARRLVPFVPIHTGVHVSLSFSHLLFNFVVLVCVCVGGCHGGRLYVWVGWSEQGFTHMGAACAIMLTAAPCGILGTAVARRVSSQALKRGTGVLLLLVAPKIWWGDDDDGSESARQTSDVRIREEKAAVQSWQSFRNYVGQNPELLAVGALAGILSELTLVRGGPVNIKPPSHLAASIWKC